MTRRVRSRQRAADAGQALTEFVLVVPLFLAMLWGLVTLISLARARLQVAIVAHAVAREAQAGVLDADALTSLAKSYGRGCGMSPAAADSLRVEVGNSVGGLGLGGTSMFGEVMELASGWVRLRVKARVQVPDALRLLTGPVELASETTCVIGTWKAPWALLGRLIRMPDPRAEQGNR